MSELGKELRELLTQTDLHSRHYCKISAAADHIDALEAEAAELRASLDRVKEIRDGEKRYRDEVNTAIAAPTPPPPPPDIFKCQCGASWRDGDTPTCRHGQNGR